MGQPPPGRRVGLIRSHFRPSDDASRLPFPVAANVMLACELTNVADRVLRPTFLYDDASRCDAFAAAVSLGVLTAGTARLGDGARVLAYEVDGFGSSILMDDANVPSLLALPMYWHGDGGPLAPLYETTRARILSPTNPHYACGASGVCAIGSPHVGYGWVWPLSLVVQGWTAVARRNATEACAMVHALVRSSAGTGLLHESYAKDDPSQFTRPWFAMANSLFGEFVLKLADEMPDVLFAPGSCPDPYARARAV